MSQLSDGQIELLLKLAGMKYCPGKYSPEEWTGIAHVDPAQFQPLIGIKNNRCFWSKEAEKIYQNWSCSVAQNWKAIGA